MAPNTRYFRMADRFTEGRLADILREAQAAGHTYQVIARDLYTGYGIEVSHQTVANWIAALNDEAVAS